MEDGDSSQEYDEYLRIADEIRAEVKALAKEEGEQSSSYDREDARRINPKAHYDIGLCARLALYCYNLHKGTAYDYRSLSELDEDLGRSFTRSFIAFEAVNPADSSPLTLETCVKHIGDRVMSVPNLWWETLYCTVEGSEEEDDYEWNDGAVNPYYKGAMPEWPSDEDQQQQRYSVVKQSEIADEKNGWLHLLAEFAFFTKWHKTLTPGEVTECLPLIIRDVVVETCGDEPSDKLNADNAILYISFVGVEDPTNGRYRAVLRKTMDGKPGHLRLEVKCWSL